MVASEKMSATLLFVDDEANILSSLQRLFRPLGYRIFTATSGAQGLELLEREKINVVISDMRMPEMDGAEFLEQVARRWPQAVRILLTGYANLGSAVAAVNKGNIYRYLNKPWEDSDLKITVQQALEKQRLELRVAEQNAQPKDHEGAALDRATLDSLRSLLGAEFPALVADFLRDTTERLAAMRLAAQRADAVTLHELAHTLKGSSANMGAPGLAACCAQLDALARGGATEGSDVHLAGIEAEYARVAMALQAAAAPNGTPAARAG